MTKIELKRRVFKTFVSAVLIFSMLNVYFINIFGAGSGTIKVQLREYSKGAVTNVAIQNSEFELKKVGNSAFSLVGKTDSTGNYTFSGLENGEYEIIQRTTPDTYKLPNTNYTVNLTNGNNNSTVTVSNIKKNSSNIVNILPKGKTSTTLRLKVVSNADGQTPVANASFLVTSMSGVRKEITTNQQGTATLEGLFYGDYTVTQISTPEGFMASPKEAYFEIPKPDFNGYAEFVDIKFLNEPYDAQTYGTLKIDVFDNKETTKVIPNVKLLITDDIGNSFVGSTDSKGSITFKNFSKERTYSAKIIQSPYDYEYSGATFEQNIKLDATTNSGSVSMYLPKKQTAKVTVVNHETGDLSVRLSGSKFKLIHPDGSSREFEIPSSNSNGSIELDLPLSTDGDYILEQLTTDDRHIVHQKLNFSLGREATVYVANNLKDPKSEKVSFSFTKEWVDKPASDKQVVVKLMQDGKEYGNGQQYTLNSKDGTQTREFKDLPKYNSDHIAHNYSVKEDPVEGWYAEYQEISKNNWKISNYEGSMTGQCIIDPSKGLIWFSGENSAYMMENGVDIKKTIIFPTTKDSTFGYGIAYDRTKGYLYGANRRGELAVMDPSRGENGALVKMINLGGIREKTGDGSDDSGKWLKDNGQDIFVHKDFRKLNCLETSVDGKYLFAKVLADPNIYMYRISDILSNNVASGGTVQPVKTIHAKHKVAANSAAKTPVSDGDIIQYPNGDILYSGHAMYFFRGDLTSPQRADYNFYLLKYTGDLDSNGKVIDAAQGSYSEPINVGRLRVPGEFNSSWDAANRDTSIEGMTYARGYIWFTSVIKQGNNVTKRLARIVRSQPNLGNLPNRTTYENVNFEAQKLEDGNGNTYGTKIQNLPTTTFCDMTGGDREICSPEVIVRGAKTWVGDDESTRPKQIEVQLYADGKPYSYPNGNSSKVILNKENNWRYQFSQLPKYDSNNQKINYTVKETNPPSNYLMTETDYSITNTLIKGEFSIKKTNEDKSKALGGAKFSLLNEAKDKIIQSSSETDDNGVVTFKGLTAGTYYLQEEVAPEFYQKDAKEYKVVGTVNQNTKKIDFEIFKEGSKVETQDGKHIIKNTKPKYKLKLVKIDSKTGQKITNSKTRFAVVDSNGQTINGQVQDFNGEVVFDNGGKKFEAGTYYLKEETAPNGYKAINNLIPITISNDGKVFLNTADNDKVDAYGVNVTGNDTVEIKIKNDRDNVRFVFSKRIKGIENTGRHIKTETEFKLTKDNDNTFVPQTIKQNADKNFVFENLTEGVYTLEETKAPNGYVLDTVSYKVVVDSVGNVSLYSNENTEKIKNITDKDFIKSSDLTNIHSGTEANAIDGKENTAVVFAKFDNQSNTLPAGSYVGVDLKVLYYIGNIKFLQGAPSNAADRYNKCSLEYSLDGITWKNFKNYEETDTTKNVWRPVNKIEETNLNINARYIRFKNNETRKDVWFGVKEIQVEGTKYNLIKTMTPQMQISDTDGNIAFIGNIQNPQIQLEKIDADTENIITQNNPNKAYNAKFKLFKVDDNKESITEEEISKLTSIQEFTLDKGKAETVQLADKLGRYVLVETESPSDYEKVSPIFLDLVETQQIHSGTQKKNTTSWKAVENTTGGTINESGDYTTFSGIAKNDKVVLDYSKLAQNKITLKVKNTKSSKKVKIKVRKVNENNELIKGTQIANVARISILGSDKKVLNGQDVNMFPGEFTFDNKGAKFGSGLYYLKEERAPKEYVLIDKEIPFYIKDTGEIIIPAKLKAGSNDEYKIDEEFSYKNQIKIEKSTDVDTITISVENKKVKYPQTGGSGVLRYVLIGSAIMGVTSFIIIKRRRYLR